MPYEYLSYTDSKAHKYDSVEIIWQSDVLDNKKENRWPGKHKNVHFWVLLENGYAVGWNENSVTGWSFPLIKIKDFFGYENSLAVYPPTLLVLIDESYNL